MSPVVGSLESTIHRPSVRHQYRPSVVRQVQIFHFQQTDTGQTIEARVMLGRTSQSRKGQTTMKRKRKAQTSHRRGEITTGRDVSYAETRRTRHRTVLRRPDLQANGSDLISIGTIRLYKQVRKEDLKVKATHRLVWTSFLLRGAKVEVEWEVRLGPSYPHNDQADGT